MRIRLELELGAGDPVSTGAVHVKDNCPKWKSLGVLEGGIVKSVHVTDVIELITRPDPSQIVEWSGGFRPDRAGRRLTAGKTDGTGKNKGCSYY